VLSILEKNVYDVLANIKAWSTGSQDRILFCTKIQLKPYFGSNLCKSILCLLTLLQNICHFG